MPEENVDLVRTTFAAFNDRDFDRALEFVHDDYEMDWSNSIGPMKGVYRGREELQRAWTAFLEAWDEVTWEPEEIVELDDATLIVVNHIRMRGRGSGVPTEAIGAQLWRIDDGLIRSIKLYQSKADALAEVSEPD